MVRGTVKGTVFSGSPRPKPPDSSPVVIREGVIPFYGDSNEFILGQLQGRRDPPADMAFARSLEDLADRGMLDETLVVWVGEFGRSPKVNAKAGREH